MFCGNIFTSTDLQNHKKIHMKKLQKRFHQANRALFLSLSIAFEEKKFIPKISPTNFWSAPCFPKIVCGGQCELVLPQVMWSTLGKMAAYRPWVQVSYQTSPFIPCSLNSTMCSTLSTSTSSGTVWLFVSGPSAKSSWKESRTVRGGSVWEVIIFFMIQELHWDSGRLLHNRGGGMEA